MTKAPRKSLGDWIAKVLSGPEGARSAAGERSLDGPPDPVRQAIGRKRQDDPSDRSRNDSRNDPIAEVSVAIVPQDRGRADVNPPFNCLAMIQVGAKPVPSSAAGAAQAHARRWEAGSSVQLQMRCGWKALWPIAWKAVPSMTAATR